MKFKTLLVDATRKAASLLLCSGIIVIGGEWIFRGTHALWPWLSGNPAIPIVTTMIVVLVVLATHVVFSLRASVLLVASGFAVFSIADRAKLARLGLPVSPPDFLLWDQYLTLARMIWGWRELICALVATGIVVALAWRYRARVLRARDRRLSLLVAITATVLLASLVAVPDYNYRNARFKKSVVADRLDALGISNLNWALRQNVEINGQILANLMNAKSALIPPPFGYSRSSVVAALCPLPTSIGPLPSASALPDIVVIMSEAWWDPTIMQNVGFSDPLLTNLHAKARGKLFSPVFGGYTANSEFEFLTRLSMAYLPRGSIPYLQFINHTVEALPRTLQREGYETIAVHPFDPTFWDRDKVYPRLGFERFHDMSQFTHRDMTPPYISDRSMGQEIVDLLAAPSARPRFVFAVSVQNHGPYNSPDKRYAPADTVSITRAPASLSEAMRGVLSTYASGVRDAVNSYNLIVDQIAATGRPTIVVMFGDHLPFLGSNFQAYTEAGLLKDADEAHWSEDDTRHMHEVPVVAWWNGTAPVELPTSAMSPIYLSQTIERAAGLPGDAIDRLAQVLHGFFPVISTFYSTGPDATLDQAPRFVKEADRYSMIEYDALFGANHTHTLLDGPTEACH